MKTILKISAVAIILTLMLIADLPLLFEQGVPPLFDQLVPEAHAILGVRRRAFRRGVIVGESVAAESASTAAAQQQAATAQQQAAAAQQQAAAAAPSPPPPASAGKPLPLGTVVSTLPAGCAPKTVGGVAYYHCGGNYYRAVFQGNNLVYVTAEP